MSKKISLVLIHAEWCQPCKVMVPTMNKIMSKKEFNNIPFKLIDADNDTNDYSTKYNIRNIPSLLILDEKENLIQKITGAVPEFKVIEELRDAINTDEE